MIIINGIISDVEQSDIIQWVNNFRPASTPATNVQSKNISDGLNGYSVLFQLTNTDLVKQVIDYQGEKAIEQPPEFLIVLKDRLVNEVDDIDGVHVFVQVIVLNPGGEITPHYDASVLGYINYKCNVFVECPNPDTVYVDKEAQIVRPKGLVCFESSLYKHWMDVASTRRVVLSYGFMVKYENLGFTLDSPRVKLSNKIMRIV